MRIEQFIAARLDEDEAAAQECTAKNFHMVPRFTGYMDVEAHYRAVEEQGHFQWFTAHYPGFTPPYAHHIARHDPARVLREVRTWRAMVRAVFEYEGELDHLSNAVPDDERSNVDHLPALRAIAAIWSGHPDYLPGWLSNPL